MKYIYFDNAATTSILPEVIDYMNSLMKEEYANPSSVHAAGRKARTIIEESRKIIAEQLNVSPGEIIFTSGGTESDNMALVRSVFDLNIKHIITSPTEHHAVLYTANELERLGLIKVSILRVDDLGRPDFLHLEELLNTNPNSLVSLMHANNETGTIISLKKVSKICRKYNALFHSDTVQTLGHLPINLKDIDIDFIAGSAHKFNGPKGIGFIYINNSNHIHSFIYGGSQERNLRAGTENIYGIAGMALAFKTACENMEEDKNRISSLKSELMRLLQENIPGVTFNGDTSESSLYTVLNVAFPENSFSEMMIYKLDMAGIACSGGSACSSGANKQSHVMKALQSKNKGANIRFSFGRFNTMEEVKTVAERIINMYN